MLDKEHRNKEQNCTSTVEMVEFVNVVRMDGTHSLPKGSL